MTARSPSRVPAVRVASYSFRLDRRAIAVGCGLIVATLFAAALTLSTGDFHIPLADVIRTLTGRGTGTDSFVIMTLRLPRLTAAILVGAALGVGGAMFQSLTHNPLGSPDIVGFNTGAATGALVAILVLKGSMVEASVGALIGGTATAMAVYLLAFKRGVQGHRLILIGIGIAAMLTSVNWYLLTRANITDAQAAAAWITGSLNGRTWDHVIEIAWAVAILLPAAMWCGRGLRILQLGDDAATGLGARVEGIRLASILVGVGITAIAISVAGPIAFIALAAPQVAHRLTRSAGPDIAASALTGAFLLVAADLVAQRVFSPMQLPVGVATGAIGGVYLAWLLSREWRRGRG